MPKHPMIEERGFQPGDSFTILPWQAPEFLALPHFSAATSEREEAEGILGYDHGVTIYVDRG